MTGEIDVAPPKYGRDGLFSVYDYEAKLTAGRADRVLDAEIMFDLFAVSVGNNPRTDGGPFGYIWPENQGSWNFGIRFPGRDRETFKTTSEIETLVIWRDDAWVLMNALRIPRLTASIDAAISLIKHLGDRINQNERDIFGEAMGLSLMDGVEDDFTGEMARRICLIVLAHVHLHRRSVEP